MSVVARLGLLLALGLYLSSFPGHAQEADDLRLDGESADSTAGFGDDIDIDAPPPPPRPGQPLTIPDPEPPRKKRKPVEDPYAAQGIDAGAFRLFPKLELGSFVTSNAGSSSTGEPGTGLRLKPSLKVESNWVRHELSVDASSEWTGYPDNEDLNTTTADMAAKLRLDIRRNIRAELEAGYTLASTGASDSEVPDTATGNRSDQTFRLSAALAHEGGVIETATRAALTRQVFDDVELSGGGTEDNSDRNYTELGLALRGTFNNGARIRPFAEVSYTPRFHDKETDRNGIARDSHGYGLALGLRFEDDSVWSGELAATYLIRDYEDESLDTERAPGLLANLLWRPTEITQVAFTTAVTLNETTSTGEGARASWNGGVTLTHALRENIDLTAGTTIAFTEDTDGYDRTLGAKAGVTWQFNPYVAWSVNYEGTWFTGASSKDYDEQRVIASIILQR